VTVSTCGGTEVLYYMAKIFSLHNGGVDFFDYSPSLTPFEGKSPLYELIYPSHKNYTIFK